LKDFWLFTIPPVSAKSKKKKNNKPTNQPKKNPQKAQTQKTPQNPK